MRDAGAYKCRSDDLLGEIASPKSGPRAGV